MRNQAVIVLLALLGTTAQAADQDRELARQLALQQKNLQPLLGNPQYQSPLPKLLQKASTRLKRQATDADQAAIRRQGLEGEVTQLMQLRLANPEQAVALKQGVEPLVAYVPSGDEQSWSAIEAFDTAGNPVYLDVNQPPARPVLVVEADPVKAKNAGLRVMRKALAEADLQAAPRAADSTAPLKTSILKKIRLQDDQEPWLLGAAEVYAVVAGVNPSRDEPVVDIVDLPYLDHDNTDYSPNQILVYWDRYRWGAVDLVMMEQDDNVNYKELSALLIEALKLGFTAGGVPETLPFLDLGGRIVKALPDSWMTNNDDYLDTFYTLEQDQIYHQYPGAAGNAVITLEPKEIQPTRP
ncbi:DUF3103 family protein [Aeromonas encheleia]|uniref:DUF3103 domain-containing protein n=1 Tax=Aeromonas encheleia TaxID=73010 RepID=A0AAE9MGL8_9GAMM|nr:DUF3103 family protein [Aeromonas encheleia]USV57295.1 DUF3103 domain-containing protein [Aeromonas encheleia]